MADLTYTIRTRSLFGRVGDTFIDIVACGSGGHAGAKKTPLNPKLANNMWATGVKEKGTAAGGPLPMCVYKMSAHNTKHDMKTSLKCVWLDPTHNHPSMMQGRAGMLIHGRGPVGSAGCIVLERADLDVVWTAVQKAPNTTLSVIGAMGDFEKIQSQGVAFA